VEQDEALGLPIGPYAGGRGWQGEDHDRPESKGLHSALRLSDYSAEKKGKNKEV